MLTLLNPSDDLMDLKLMEAIHGYVIKNISKLSNKFLMHFHSMIAMYCNCESITGARKLLKGLKVKDTMLWNSMIFSYEKHGNTLRFSNFPVMYKKDEILEKVIVTSVCSACNPIPAHKFFSFNHIS